MNENKIIVIFILIVIILGGILALRIFTDKPNRNLVLSKENMNNEKIFENSIEKQPTDETTEVLEEGTEYAARKAKETQDNMNVQKEKEDIQLVVGLVLFGENSINELTYDGLNEQLKIKFGEGNYKLSGPDDKGNYTIKMNYGTYNIDKSGKVSN